MKSINGYVDNIGSSFISGWVIRDGQKGPVWVRVLVNGKIVRKRQKANLFRNDVFLQKMHFNGNCGFRFKNLNLKKGDIIVVEAGIEKIKLPLTENVVNWLMDYSKLIPTKDCYFFMHIPKTAGTSFRIMLYQVFDQKEILPNEEDLNLNNNFYPLNIREFIDSCSEVKLNNIQLLVGHYYNQSEKYFKSPPRLILFLRNPLNRAISHLLHLKKHEHKYINTSFENIYKKRSDMFYNTQVRFISGCDKPGNFNKNKLEIAKKRIEKASFIGITSRFEESIKLLEYTFNWKFKEQSSTKNVNKKYTIEDLSSELIEEIKSVNQLDQQLYEFGVELFEERLASMRTKI